MTRIETARVKETLDLSITQVRQAAERLNSELELQELQTEVEELEKAVAALKGNIAGLPFKRKP
ncbi:hypothetical protein GMSM_19800 [Geomonas sp. Red276]